MILWAVVATALVEAITIYLRFRGGISAAAFNRTAPLLLQIHHMFWSIPLFLLVPLVWRHPRVSGASSALAWD